MTRSLSLTERLEAHRDRLGDAGASWQLANDLSAAIQRIEELEARVPLVPSDPFPPAPMSADPFPPAPAPMSAALH